MERKKFAILMVMSITCLSVDVKQDGPQQPPKPIEIPKGSNGPAQPK